MKTMRYAAEAVVLSVALLLFKTIGMQAASSLGGWIGRTIGPRLAASRKARANIQNALPHADPDTIITQMWDNLGRVMAEYPHLEQLGREAEVSGLEHVPDEGPCILISGHLANWEILASVLLAKGKKTPDIVYRTPNNPFSAWLLDLCRTLNGRVGTIPKSQSGTRQLVQGFGKRKRPVMILIDQKYNEGIPLPFLGRPAMTSTATPRLAAKFGCPLIPYRVERIAGTRLRLTFHPAILVEGRTDEDVLMDAHRLIEGWITERPGEWLWLHRRWDSALVNGD